MLSVSPVANLFLYGQPADLRRGFDGLAAIVQDSMGEDPLSGSLFIFLNRRCNRVKLLYWDRDGYAVWYKRLERGSFERPSPVDESDSACVEITASQLSLILEGIELRSVRRRRRYQRTRPERVKV
jgi:transposase